LKTALYNRYSFVSNIKSTRVARFLAKIAFVFKRTKRSIYYKLLKPFRFPFRIGTKTTNFYLKHRPNRNTISYNDYRSLKIFFGSLKPEIFWKGSRAAVTKDTLGWSFIKKYSYLDLRLDYLISRLGFVENMFEGKNLIDNRQITLNGHVVQTNNLIVKPYDWIEVSNKERFNFKLSYLSKLVVQRTQNYNLKSIPTFIEINWQLFRFFILPLISLNDIVRPYKTFNYHVGSGKKQPAKLS
jgi:ribosomal protein S4